MSRQVLQRHHPPDVGSAEWQAGDLAGRTDHTDQLPVHPAGRVAGGEGGTQEAHPGKHPGYVMKKCPHQAAMIT